MLPLLLSCHRGGCREVTVDELFRNVDAFEDVSKLQAKQRVWNPMRWAQRVTLWGLQVLPLVSSTKNVSLGSR